MSVAWQFLVGVVVVVVVRIEVVGGGVVGIASVVATIVATMIATSVAVATTSAVGWLWLAFYLNPLCTRDMYPHSY